MRVKLNGTQGLRTLSTDIEDPTRTERHKNVSSSLSAVYMQPTQDVHIRLGLNLCQFYFGPEQI